MTFNVKARLVDEFDRPRIGLPITFATDGSYPYVTGRTEAMPNDSNPTILTDANGQVSIDLASTTDEIWRVMTPYQTLVKFPDPGDAVVINMNQWVEPEVNSNKPNTVSVTMDPFVNIVEYDDTELVAQVSNLSQGIGQDLENIHQEMQAIQSTNISMHGSLSEYVTSTRNLTETSIRTNSEQIATTKTQLEAEISAVDAKAVSIQQQAVAASQQNSANLETLSGKVTDNLNTTDSRLAAIMANQNSAVRQYMDIHYQDIEVRPSGLADDTDANRIMAAYSRPFTGRIRLSSGNFVINKTIDIPRGSSTLSGQGPNSTILIYTPSGNPLIRARGVDDKNRLPLVALEHMELQATTDRSDTDGQALLHYEHVEGYSLQNIRWLDGGRIADFIDCHSGWYKDLKVAHFNKNIHRGFYWSKCVDTHLSGVLINGGTLSMPSTGAWYVLDGGIDTFVADDIGGASSSGSSRGLLIKNTNGDFDARWLRFSNYLFEGAHFGSEGQRGIQIDNAFEARFSQGYVATSSSGIYITGGKNISFNSGIVVNSWLHGIVVTNNAENVKFNDWVIDESSQGGDKAAPHIYLGPNIKSAHFREITFMNEYIYPGGSVNRPDYSVEGNAGPTSDINFDNCWFKPTAHRTGAFTNPKNMSIRNCVGYNPRGSLAAPALPSSGQLVTNPFGVETNVYVTGAGVTDVVVNGVSTGLTSGAFPVGPLDSIGLAYGAGATPVWRWLGK